MRAGTPLWVLGAELEQLGLALPNRIATRLPRTTKSLVAIAGRALGERQFTERSHRVFVSERKVRFVSERKVRFVSERKVRFVESEWAFPRAALRDVLPKLRDWVDTHDEQISFPVECRVAAADDVWLSTAHERESCYVAILRGDRRQPSWSAALGQDPHPGCRLPAGRVPTVRRLRGGARPGRPAAPVRQPLPAPRSRRLTRHLGSRRRPRNVSPGRGRPPRCSSSHERGPS